MNATRRGFLRGALGAVGLGVAGPIAYVKLKELHDSTDFLPAAASPAPAGSASAAPAVSVRPSGSPAVAAASASGAARPVAASGPAPRSLVVIQLAGGNDGLATVLPYADPSLKDARSTLDFTDDQLLKLTDQAALHPNMKGIKALWDQKKVAIVQGVGYPNPNRSHFASMDIWASASPDKPATSGWLGRYLDAAQLPSDNPFNATSIGTSLPFALRTQKTAVATVQDANTFTFRTDPRHPQDHQALMASFTSLYQRGPGGVPYYGLVEGIEGTAAKAADDLKSLSGAFHPAVQYPQTDLGRQLQNVAELMSGNFGTRIFYVSTSGFDTHANEKTEHDRLMATLSDAVSAFYQDLAARGQSQNVVMMTWSEFGRRVKENGSGGTDHGTAAPMFVIGDAVKGALIGNQPSLTKVDSNGDLVFGIDFRAVYNTLLTKWLGMDGQEVLGAKFDVLPLF